MSQIEKIESAIIEVTMSDYIGESLCEESCNVIIQALQEKLERENPQPLGLEELISNRGKPLYMKDITNLPFGYGDKWFICDLDNLPSAFYEYGKTWLAYRYEPKGV